MLEFRNYKIRQQIIFTADNFFFFRFGKYYQISVLNIAEFSPFKFTRCKSECLEINYKSSDGGLGNVYLSSPLSLHRGYRNVKKKKVQIFSSEFSSAPLRLPLELQNSPLGEKCLNSKLLEIIVTIIIIFITLTLITLIFRLVVNNLNLLKLR